jgi:rod shape-determining protein MreC
MKFFKRNNRIVFFVSFFLCVILIIINIFFSLDFIGDATGFVVVPIEKSFCVSINWIESKFKALTNVFSIESENIKLKKKIDIYKINEQRTKMLEEENKSLRELINLVDVYKEYKLVGARVIAKDVSNWFDVFIIDKGLNDGIKNNMPVMISNSLVGKIVDAKKNYSKVCSIIDDKSSVSIKNSRTGDLGFVKGDLKLKLTGLCKLEFLDNDTEIMQGDEIITSQLSEIFPPGLLVGHVKEINNNENSKTGILKPEANLKNLDYVLIITNNFYKQDDIKLDSGE